MKHLFFLLVSMSIMGISVFGQNTMFPSHTIKIEEDDSREEIIRKAAHVIPTGNQYDYKKTEFNAFIHFGPNTFTRMEWGTGMEDPAIFNLQNLDTDQWCRAMKAAGMRMVVFTAKHHDGFVLWQSRYTNHGVMSSPFRDGEGDVLKELAQSCHKYGLRLGVYLSPADLYQIENPNGLYGNLSKATLRTIPRPVEGRPFENETTFEFEIDDYNEYFLNQLFELLTEYGPIHEVWFDGAHPKRKGGQTYNYPAWKKLIRTLAPDAVIFGREDVRWCGNESGATRQTEWDVIPSDKDPNRMIQFPDLTRDDLGSREKLYTANFLHYLPAETNTSIREGWFYRDETNQKVRNVDDVFDIYERAVGGNSTLLLNIPPNREGRFSDEDVQVLKEVGQRIRETYGTDLLMTAGGPGEVLDNDEYTFVEGNGANSQWEITLPGRIQVNRFVLQEAISTHGQRIEAHALDAMIEGNWQEVAIGTTVGYKKILRFPAVTTDRFRIRVLKSRLNPTLSKVSAHYYQSRPPQIAITRDAAGEITLAPKADAFSWKSHGIDATGNLNKDMEIRYTLDGSTPDGYSHLYKEPFVLQSGEVKARAFSGEQEGGETQAHFGILKKNWKLLEVSSNEDGFEGEKAFDNNPATYWQSETDATYPHSIAIELGSMVTLTGFAYTPQTGNGEGMMERGTFYISLNGKKWKKVTSFEFGNLINDPTTRSKTFEEPVQTRYVKITDERGAGGSEKVAVAEVELFD